LPEATDDGAEICRAARGLLASAELSEPIRLLGVGTTGLVPADPEQLSLLEGGRNRRNRLNRALDGLAERFGSGVVRRAQQAEVSRAALSLQIKRGDEGD
jgi:hypothetical protein